MKRQHLPLPLHLPGNNVQLPDMPLDISRIHALCIDLDGTISDTDDVYVQALLRWLAPLRSFLSQKRLGRLARWLVMSAETPGNFVMRILDRLHLDRFYHRLRAKHKGSTSIQQAVQEKSAYRMIPGVREILDIAKA
jgi:beta-phosphoglucomutase-like phosphatase (HAD superfamily)